MLLNDMHEVWNNLDNNTAPVVKTLHTNGNGYWSNVAKAVGVTAMCLGYVDEDGEFGELRVYFNTDTWKTTADGLIYTDKLFKQELRAWLSELGFNAKAVDDVSYSEQGMQGRNYVSLDVGKYYLQEMQRLDKAHYDMCYAECNS